MENKNTLILIVITAILSSACTAAAINLIGRPSGPDYDISAIRSQLTQLKNELANETQARVFLAQKLGSSESINSRQSSDQSNGEPSRLPSADRPPQNQQARQEGNDEARREAQRERREQLRLERVARQQPNYREEQLVSAGFAQEEAARIVQIEAEESLRQLQAQYNARRDRAALDESTFSNTNPIRAELGDQNYQRYLEANGLPTAARIGSVIGGSPGQGAGLRAGDNIVSYAGERVFSLNEINNLTIQGNLGESVLIEVERNNETLQLTIPRGPIGINSRGTRFRR